MSGGIQLEPKDLVAVDNQSDIQDNGTLAKVIGTGGQVDSAFDLGAHALWFEPVRCSSANDEKIILALRAVCGIR